jgi:flagellar biosynthetic protein FliR
MIVLEQGAIFERLWSLILVSVRMSGMLVIAPFFAASAISTPIRVALAISISFILSSIISIPNVDMFSGPAVVLLLREGLIGLMIGLIYQLAFASIAMAGEQIAFSMGLGFASMIDPQTGAQSPVITQFLSILLILVFLAIEGHHVLLQQVVASYSALPIELSLDSKIYLDLVRSAGLVFSVAIIFAMPIIVALLCSNLLIGLLTRVAPQMNIFSVGFPITILIGIALLLILVPNMSDALAGLIELAATNTRKLILGEAG